MTDATPQTDSDVDVEAVERRLNAITPGEWAFFPDEFHRDDIRVCNADDGKCIGCLLLVGNYDYDKDEWTEETIKQAEANAEFIAHAPADIRALLADNASLREQVAALTQRAEAAEAAAEAERETRIQWGRERQNALDYVRWTKAALKPFALWAKEALKMGAFDNLPDDRTYDGKNEVLLTLGDLRNVVARYESADTPTSTQENDDAS